MIRSGGAQLTDETIERVTELLLKQQGAIERSIPLTLPHAEFKEEIHTVWSELWDLIVLRRAPAKRGKGE